MQPAFRKGFLFAVLAWVGILYAPAFLVWPGGQLGATLSETAFNVGLLCGTWAFVAWALPMLREEVEIA